MVTLPSDIWEETVVDCDQSQGHPHRSQKSSCVDRRHSLHLSLRHRDQVEGWGSFSIIMFEGAWRSGHCAPLVCAGSSLSYVERDVAWQSLLGGNRCPSDASGSKGGKVSLPMLVRQLWVVHGKFAGCLRCLSIFASSYLWRMGAQQPNSPSPLR